MWCEVWGVRCVRCVRCEVWGEVGVGGGLDVVCMA